MISPPTPTISGVNNVSLHTGGASSKVVCPDASLTIEFTITGIALAVCNDVDIDLYSKATSNLVATLKEGYSTSGQVTSYTYTTESAYCGDTYYVRVFCSNTYFGFSNEVEFYSSPTLTPTLGPTRAPTLEPTKAPSATTPSPTPDGFRNATTVDPDDTATPMNRVTCLEDIAVTWLPRGTATATACDYVDIMIYSQGESTPKDTVQYAFPNDYPSATYTWTTTSAYCDGVYRCVVEQPLDYCTTINY